MNTHPATPYSCLDVFQRLDDWLDRRLDADELELVRQHLESCSMCASEYQFESSVVEGLKEKLQRIDVPEDLQARVSDLLRAIRVEEERPGPK